MWSRAFHSAFDHPPVPLPFVKLRAPLSLEVIKRSVPQSEVQVATRGVTLVELLRYQTFWDI